MQAINDTHSATLSLFSVILFNESDGEVTAEQVLAPNASIAIGVVATEHKDEGSLIVICVKDEQGDLTYPGAKACYISDIIEQGMFSSGISERMLAMMVDKTNVLIARRLLVERAINPEANEDEENVYTIYAMLNDMADMLDETFTLHEDEFVNIFTTVYPNYQFDSTRVRMDISLNFTMDGILDEEGEASLQTLNFDLVKNLLLQIIENESELRDRLEVFQTSELGDPFTVDE